MARDGSIPGRTTSGALSKLLRQMFETVRAQPAPPNLIDLVEQLDRPEVDPEDEPPSARRLALA